MLPSMTHCNVWPAACKMPNQGEALSPVTIALCLRTTLIPWLLCLLQWSTYTVPWGRSTASHRGPWPWGLWWRRLWRTILPNRQQGLTGPPNAVCQAWMASQTISSSTRRLKPNLSDAYRSHVQSSELKLSKRISHWNPMPYGHCCDLPLSI